MLASNLAESPIFFGLHVLDPGNPMIKARGVISSLGKHFTPVIVSFSGIKKFFLIYVLFTSAMCFISFFSFLASMFKVISTKPHTVSRGNIEWSGLYIRGPEMLVSYIIRSIAGDCLSNLSEPITDP